MRTNQVMNHWKTFCSKYIVAALAFCAMMESKMVFAAQYQILFAFKYTAQSKAEQNYVFETKDLEAPPDAPPGQVYQWRLLEGQKLSKLDFEAMPSPSERRLKHGQASIYLNFETRIMQFDAGEPIVLATCSAQENEELLERVAGT